MSTASRAAAPAPYRGAIFDVDGTLLDTMPYWHDVGAQFLRSIGVEPEEGLGDRLFATTPRSGAEYLIQRYGLALSVEEVMAGTNAQIEETYFQHAGFKPGARELVEDFVRRGIRCTVATSTDRYCIEAAFRRLGVMDLFEAIWSAGDLNTTKGEPRIFYAAMEGIGTRVPETLVFEDGLYAIRTAKRAGFPVVGVYDSVSEADQPEIREESDFYYRSLEEFDLF